MFWVDGTNGLDSNNGLTPSTAFKTLAFASQSAARTDTINILPGIYIDDLIGSPNKSLTFEGKSGVVVFKSSSAGTLASLSKLTFTRNFRFKNIVFENWQEIVAVSYTSGEVYSPNVFFENCVIHWSISAPANSCVVRATSTTPINPKVSFQNCTVRNTDYVYRTSGSAVTLDVVWERNNIYDVATRVTLVGAGTSINRLNSRYNAVPPADILDATTDVDITVSVPVYTNPPTDLSLNRSVNAAYVGSSGVGGGEFGNDIGASWFAVSPPTTSGFRFESNEQVNPPPTIPSKALSSVSVKLDRVPYGPDLQGPRRFVVQGNFAYVISRAHKALQIIDFSDKNNPVARGSYRNTSVLDIPEDIAVSGNYIYVVDSSLNALRVFDISNPDNITHVASLTNGSGGAALFQPNGIAISGNYAYIIKSSVPTGLEVVNITTPTSPTHVATLADGVGGAALGSPFAIRIAGNFAYIVNSNGNRQLEIVNISTPTAPVHAGKTGVNALSSNPSDVAVSGNYAYIIASNTLQVVNVTTPSTPTLVATLNNGAGGAVLSGAFNIDISGNYAYITSESAHAVEVVDITTPTSPVHYSSVTDTTKLATPFGIRISGSYAYVTSFPPGNFQIINISTPSALVLQGNIYDGQGVPMLSGALCVEVSGNYAFVLSVSEIALEVLNISDPTNPTHVTSIRYGFISNPSAMRLSGNYVYILNIGSLQIYDVSDPTNPTHVGSLNDGAGGAQIQSASNLCVAGNYVYITNGSDSLEIVDVSTPSSPTHAALIVNGSGGAHLRNPKEVFVQGNYAYIASYGDSTFEIIDVTNPLAPAHIGSLSDGVGGASLSGCQNLFVYGNYAYITNYDGNSFEIVNVSNPASPVHVASVANGVGGAVLSNPYGIFVYDDYAYIVSLTGNALEVIDVFYPNAPVHYGSLTGAGLTSPLSVKAKNGYVYVTSLSALKIVQPPRLETLGGAYFPANWTGANWLNDELWFNTTAVSPGTDAIANGEIGVSPAQLSTTDQRWVISDYIGGGRSARVTTPVLDAQQTVNYKSGMLWGSETSATLLTGTLLNIIDDNQTGPARRFAYRASNTPFLATDVLPAWNLITRKDVPSGSFRYWQFRFTLRRV